MHFSISKENFAQLLYLTNTIVERKNTMPILANVKLTAEAGKLTVAATDLEVSLVGEAEATVKTPGSITVDAKVLYDIIRELPSQAITVTESKRQRLDIECGQSRFKINGTSADEFPNIAGVELRNPVSVDASKFYQMFDKTAFAVSTDETRYNINGVFAETTEGSLGPGKKCLRLVATDGHRLAMIDRPAEGFSIEQSVIVPRKGIQELKKVLEDNEGSAKVSVSDGFFTVQSGLVTLGVRLVDGQFPDYKQVIPLESTTTIQVPRTDFLSAVKRVSLVTTDKTKAVKCKVMEGSLVVSSQSPEYGEATETISVEQTGEDLTIGFSAKYLLDLLGAMSGSEMITLKLKGELGPGVFIGSGDELYTCIVMPMRFE
ncbi:MAG: DNA polymerase III subunit beta [Bdellovibrionales bacterium]|nr:DNA polymerase III subunit beta [Bdellovibrionales bacterium]